MLIPSEICATAGDSDDTITVSHSSVDGDHVFACDYDGCCAHGGVSSTDEDHGTDMNCTKKKIDKDKMTLQECSRRRLCRGRYRRRLRRQVDDLRRTNAQTERGNQLLRETLERVKAINRFLGTRSLDKSLEEHLAFYGTMPLFEHQSNIEELPTVSSDNHVNTTTADSSNSQEK
jgi:hypothetical protein